jgi:hypothetical protein
MFFLSDIGNGGVLLRPSKDYKETNEKIRQGILVLNNDNNNNNNNNNDNNDNDNGIDKIDNDQ